MRFRIVGYEPKEDPTSYRVEYWYDRRQRFWITTVYDNFDVEVETMTIAKDELKSTLEYLRGKYKTDNIKKL